MCRTDHCQFQVYRPDIILLLKAPLHTYMYHPFIVHFCLCQLSSLPSFVLGIWLTGSSKPRLWTSVASNNFVKSKLWILQIMLWLLLKNDQLLLYYVKKFCHCWPWPMYYCPVAAWWSLRHHQIWRMWLRSWMTLSWMDATSLSRRIVDGTVVLVAGAGNTHCVCCASL